MSQPNVIDLGTYIFGDLPSPAVIPVPDDLSTASTIQLGCNEVGGTDSFTIEGDGANGTATFSGLAVSGTQPPTGVRRKYTARLSWVAAGDAGPTYLHAEVHFWIEQFSAVSGAAAVTLTDLSLPATLERWNSRPISGTNLFPAIRETNLLAGSYYVNGRAHIMDTSHDPVSGAATNLANRVQEYGELSGPGRTHDVEEGLYSALSYPTIVEMWWNMDGIRQSGFPGGDCFVGFELGSLSSNTPFSATPSGGGCIQVRFHRATNDLVLYSCRGDGTSAAASKRFNFSLGLSGKMNADRRIRLEWWPGLKAKLTTWDTGEGQQRSIEQTDLTKLPLASWGAATSGFAFILCTGSSAAGNQFSASHGWIHTLRPAWGSA